MSRDVPLERLLIYKRAARTLRDRAAAAGGTAREATVAPADLVELCDLAPSMVRGDLRELGLSSDGTRLPLLDARLTSRLTAGGARASEAVRSSPSVDARRLSESVRSDDLELSLLREAAWDVATAAPDRFLFSLGALADGKTAFDHQVVAAKTLCERASCHGVMADEVGLGKTVTAGLLVIELQERAGRSNVLVVVPPNLRTQWKRTFRDFFGFSLATTEDASATDEFGWARSEDAILVEQTRAVRSPLKELLLEREWDLVVIDEAHRLRNPNTNLARFCYELKASRRLLVTATPVQNYVSDIFSLTTHVRPGYLGTKEAFEEHYTTEHGLIRSEREDELRSRLAGVQVRTKRSETGLRFAKRIIEQHIVTIESEQEQQLYDGLWRFFQAAQRFYSGGLELGEVAGHARTTQSIVVVAMQALRRLSSHPRCALATLSETFRERLLRTAPMSIPREELDRLDALVEEFRDVDWYPGRHAKTDALVARLPNLLERCGKVIVYAEFLPTIEALKEAVEAEEMGCGLFVLTGQLGQRRKDRVVEDFSTSKGNAVLLSTDCGGEGLNLQAAGGIVNFDFPWNPMRVEQRIGRIDRLTQPREEIVVSNLVTAETIERYVYNTLQQKLHLCDQILGDYFESTLTRIMVWRRSQELGIGHILLNSRSIEQLKDALEGIDRPPQERAQRKRSGRGRRGF